jgi:hypothetical protein
MSGWCDVFEEFRYHASLLAPGRFLVHTPCLSWVSARETTKGREPCTSSRLTQVEWKEGSNFFHESEAFAKGRVDRERLDEELRKCFRGFEPVLYEAMVGEEKGSPP